MLRKVCLAVFSASLLLANVGCLKSMSQPSDATMASWDYGPFPTNYKELVMSSPQIRTKDPTTPRYEFQGEPKKKWANEGSGYVYGWAGTVKSFGDVSGTHTFEYFIRNGKVLRVYQENDRRFIRF